MIKVKGHTLYGDDIDYIVAESNNRETSDFINADQYRIVLTDEGFDSVGQADLVVKRSQLSGSDYETILDIIQPT